MTTDSPRNNFNPTRREALAALTGTLGSVLIPAAARAEDSGSGSGDSSKTSPATRPWVVPLPVYTPKQPLASLSPVPSGPASTGSGECGRSTHQGWSIFSAGSVPPKYYEMRLREAFHEFHPDLTKLQSSTRRDVIWGFDGIYPGPTFAARYGEPAIVRIYNELPQLTSGFGSPEISTHLHNLHTPSESDGFTGDFFSRFIWGPTLSQPAAGQLPSRVAYRDHFYPNCYAGFSTYFNKALPYGPGNCGDETGTSPTAGKGSEALGTLWYHDHRLDFTAPNVYRGMAGFYLLFDHIDTGNENDTSPTALCLPSGIGKYDIPLLLQDKQFDARGYVVFDQFNSDGILGDKVCVNGKIQPYFRVQQRRYRFRILNGGPARFYELYLVDANGKEQAFDYIANDGNLLPAPIRGMKSIRLGVAERADIVIDFAKASGPLYLVNRLEQKDGRGPTGNLLFPGTQLLRFDVQVGAVADKSRVPDTLRMLPPLPDLNSAVTRRWEFGRSNGGWVVNGQLFDITKPMAYPSAGGAEIWIIKGTGNWSHPVHIHFEEGRILSRNGLPPPPHERGRKDVYVIGPGEELALAIRFRDFNGKYMMHCHNLTHEDHAMMIRFDVIDNFLPL